MAKNRKRRKNPGGYQPTGSAKKKNTHIKSGDSLPGAKFKMKRNVIGLSIVAVISIALIIYFVFLNGQSDKIQVKPVKTVKSVDKTKPVTNQKANIGSQKKDPKEKPDPDAPTIHFEKMVHDYGTITKGSDGSCEFTFKNLGKKPLVLSNVRSSCGCTIPTWPREPILPGNSEVIKVVYDTKRMGPINKSITVYSNASNSPVQLKIKGQVNADK